MNNKKRLVGTVLAAIMVLSIATSALPLSCGIGTGICAASDDNQYGGGAEDVEALQLAPLNPDFVAYWENPPEEFYGDVPPPMDLSHLDQLPVEGLQISDALPDSFDWRDHGKVTPVKNQNPCGTCWDFAATSALESSVLIGESVAFDFSEQSVALCVDRSWVYLYDDWDDPCNAGGNCWLASEVFIRKGSVLESCNPYDGSALQCDGSCVCDSCPAIKKVDGFRVAAWDGSQIDTIKQAIYNNGPAKMSYYHSSSYEYWDPTWGAIYDYYPCSGGTNHAVTVVGWDDDVPHPNPSHGGTGAWIIKNSWGTSDSWAGGAGVSDGYFYLAYHSSCVQRIIHLEYKDSVSGEELLYWDEAGQVGAAGYGDNDAWMASVFTADQASDLTHVDFWTTSNNAQYKIYVWDGFFGTQLAHQTGSCQEYGYYSIPLSAPISINAGQQFTVGVDMTTPGYNYPISIEKEILGRVDPPIQTDVSFIRHTGSNPWTDFADYDRNACLRARMVSEVAEPDIWVEPTSFNVTLPSDTIYSTNLTIGNNGTGALDFEIQIDYVEQQQATAIITSGEAMTGIKPMKGEIDEDGKPYVQAQQQQKVILLVIGNIVNSIPVPGTSPTGLTWDGQYLWLGDWWTDKIYKLSSSDGSIITSFSVPGSSCNGLTWDGQYLWSSDSINQRIYKITVSGSVVTSFSAPGGSSGWARDLAWDGQYLWHVDQDMRKIYKLNPSSGSVIKSFSAPDDGPVGLTWDGQYLWHSDFKSNKIYKLNSTDGSVITSFPAPASEPKGLAWDGQYLWCNVKSTLRSYQIDVGAVDDGSGWLSVSPTTGTVNPGGQTNIKVTFNTTGLNVSEYYANITIANNDPDKNPVIIPVHLTVEQEVGYFDTGSGTYPSIGGTHTGTIRLNKTIVVHKMYTYPCVGTGGHTEYVRFSGNGLDVNKTWNGYIGDYHNIIFDPPITLEANTTYNYEIRTGSYPQIIHEQSLQTANGTINCTLFTDANSRTYNNWMLAMWLG